MVITKFVYRRSWQANIINIKAFLRYSIKILINISGKIPILNHKILIFDSLRGRVAKEVLEFLKMI